MPQETGTSPMEVGFSVMVGSGISSEPEVRWWYVCTAEEVEWKGSTAVRYLMQSMLPRPYTLECTQQALVSGMCIENTIKPRGLLDLDVCGNLYKHLHVKSSGVYGFLEDLNPVGLRVSSDKVFIL